MATRRVDEQPTIADQIIFDIVTPGDDGCLNANPYKVSKIIIYRIEINVESNNSVEYDEVVYDPTALENTNIAREIYCASPTEDNLLSLTNAQDKMSQSAQIVPIYYRGVTPMIIFGTDANPAWIGSVPATDNRLILIDQNSDGNAQYGHFELHWNPIGAREGDYFICWTWTPVSGGLSKTAHAHFTLYGSTQLTTSIPTHYTRPDKYEILLERYLPEVFKMSLSNSDLSPQVLQELDMAVAKGFTFLEDIANQIVDLQDANSTHESLLPYLSNLFNLKLKSEDPTLWRGQIKRAIPLFKKKGTLEALRESMSLAGINLVKFTRMWQVISPYTWQEMISVTDPLVDEFVLEKLAILPVDLNNFELYYRQADIQGTLPEDRQPWVQLDNPLEYVELTNSEDGETILRWLGTETSYGFTLQDGDSLRIIYQVRAVPAGQQDVEDYIRAYLLLADQRDERNQTCPEKNWNVRLIEEDNELFHVIIPTRHPYFSPLIYGQVRTEFPYSENIYNMDEYNGSTRESLNPCDIDCNFIDPCTYCQSSSYVVYLEIDNLCNHRIAEAIEVLQEFTPFHAQLHAMALSGNINEFVSPPVESVEALMQIQRQDVIVAGEAQMAINRANMEAAWAYRTDLANCSTIVATDTGMGASANIVFFCPGHNLQRVFMNPTPPNDSNWLEILNTSSAGNYSLFDADNHYSQVIGTVPESPVVDPSPCTFRLSNLQYPYPPGSINASFTKEYGIKENAATTLAALLALNIKTQWDVGHNPMHIRTDEPGGAWRAEINGSGYLYVVDHILSDGTLILSGSTPSSVLPMISYKIYDATSSIAQFESNTGSWQLTGRTVVEVVDSTPDFNVRDAMREGDYALYQSNQYLIVGFVTDQALKFYVDGYSSLDAAGYPVNIYRRLIDNGIGFFVYQGLVLNTTTDYETALNIENGEGHDPSYENSNFKENFLIVVNGNYYSMGGIDHNAITLVGPTQVWPTGGTPVTFSVYQYSRVPFAVYNPDEPVFPVHHFGDFKSPTGDENWESDKLDRRGKSLIELTTVNNPPSAFWAWAENAVNNVPEVRSEDKPKEQAIELVTQKEAITYAIEWRNKYNRHEVR